MTREKKSGFEDEVDLFDCPVEFFVGGNNGCKQVPARDAVKKKEEGRKEKMRGGKGGLYWTANVSGKEREKASSNDRRLSLWNTSARCFAAACGGGGGGGGDYHHDRNA